MNAADLLRRYAELARWETLVAEPKGILTDLARYPEPYQQDARLFAARWKAGDVTDLAAGGSVIENDSLGFLVQAIETPEAVLIVDDTTGDGFFRVPKNKPEDCPRMNADAVG